MFTRDQIEEIKKKLIMLGTKDTQFPDAHKLNGEEIIAIVQDGENKKIPLSSIINDDFINVSKDTTEILTLSTAVSKIDINRNGKYGNNYYVNKIIVPDDCRKPAGFCCAVYNADLTRAFGN